MTVSAESYARGEATPALLDYTIGEALVRAAAQWGDRMALVDAPSRRRWSYQELLDACRACAAGTQRAGINRGDRVGIWAPNIAEWVIVQLGTALAGVILVNINPSYRQQELEYALDQSGIVAVFTMTRFKNSEYVAMLETARHAAPQLRHIVAVDTPAWDSYCQPPDAEERRDLDARGGECNPDEVINIQYTSGTTGFPKGASLTHSNILNNGYLVGELVNYTADDTICIPAPFYHCFGMVMGNLAVITHGATMVIPAAAFDPRATLAAVAAEKCTSLYGVPTMFIAELTLDDFADYDLSSLRTGIMAGSPCPAEVMRKVVDVMGMSEVSIAYGMTETSPVSTQTRTDDALDLRVGTVGRVGPHVEIQIVDPVTDTVVPRGEVGELCTRGYSVMDGYWNEPEKTADAIDANGWMHTGDLATMDDSGYLRITGRIKDMVIRGGENIYPREIEEFLYTHPDIVDAQVIGVPDDRYGEELMAWVRLRDSAGSMTADDIREFASGKIARHKIPRYVQVVDEFPMTVSGKVRKVEMRAQAEKLLGIGE